MFHLNYSKFLINYYHLCKKRYYFNFNSFRNMENYNEEKKNLLNIAFIILLF